jgi:hypothetical protein
MGFLDEIVAVKEKWLSFYVRATREINLWIYRRLIRKSRQDIREIKESTFLARQNKVSQLDTSYMKKSFGQRILEIPGLTRHNTSFLSEFGTPVVGLKLVSENLNLAKWKVVNFESASAYMDGLLYRNQAITAVCVLKVPEQHNTETQKRCSKKRSAYSYRKSITISVPYKENIIQMINVDRMITTALYGYFWSLDKFNIEEFVPNHSYTLIKRCRRPSLHMISRKTIFQAYSLPIWLLLNEILGMISKGHWIGLH